jgi:hypothetical protein
LVKDQHLPVLICESSASRSDLARVATEIDDALIEFHGLRVYAIIFVGSNGLPRQVIHGRKRIHALMAKRQFIQGQLNIRYIKIDVDRTIFNLAVNEDPSVKDVWHSGLGYDTAIRSGAIIPHPQKQHTGMEIVRSVADERVDYDLSRFTNIVDMLQWRASMYPEENAFVVATHAGQALNTKSYSWKKVSYKAATIAIYLSKKGIKRGAKIIVFVPFGIDYLLCIYACLTLGIVPVPIEPADPQQNPQRAPELTKLMVDATRDIGTCAIITNSNGDDILKNNIVKAAIRKSSPQGYKLPEIINVSKASKQKRLLGKESGIFVRPDWISVNRNSPAIITVQHSPDGRRYYAHLAHSTILNQCRTQKVTCQMRFQRCIVTTGLGTYDSLGLLHSVFCGVYVGRNTFVDFFFLKEKKMLSIFL